jgi:5S rRNA maturation endonuclease (ribonuclease M5)
MVNLRVIKNTLNESQVIEALSALGSEPPLTTKGALIFDTVCHNDAGCGSKKLYYYLDSKMFKCYTGCGDFFDIFELISRAPKNKQKEITSSQGVYWLYKNTKTFFTEDVSYTTNKIDKVEIDKEITYYDEKELDILKSCQIKDWVDEGITFQTIEDYKIKYNPVSCSIIIPHFDIDNKLIGIRQRTLVKEEEIYGKYRAAFINGKSYPHPLSYNLFGLSINKENIKKYKKAIIFEGEKSVLMLDKYEDTCAVACCGSSISAYQIKLLVDLGVEEVIVAFDKEFVSLGDELYAKQVKNLTNLHKRFSDKATISFVFDKWELLDIKNSPVDKGIETFKFLLSERFTLQEE